ncbi:rhodanese-like domain-containing protein [Gemmobacter caeruleus]|uniref:rhodanese-like domain-containing protein n=1 Tax=Gemmobacter caeruleus TaxID=2595004 RepID=UPI0011F00E37|nr:rhodanese-like domain-containing protein [Gemmobacter caeruleus]
MFNFLKPAGPRPQSISPAEAVSRAGKGEILLIDVRDISELKSSGKAKGALHVPMMVFQQKMTPGNGELPQGVTTDTPLCLYCAAGGRAGMAAEAALKMGYTTVYNLGNLAQWQAGGGAVEKV